ncbi:ATP-binding protein [Termitidicoccus mucosus]|uniref:histidine kinase n=1 Tax=Termitidicoccus mucosus TaxID=1184151 RepID=A0A178IBJ8_9BACT|nr:histidine kinase [Opitutaceae bacterium TSB47]
MLFAIIIILGIALCVALLQIAQYRRAARGLSQAIITKQPFLREDIPGASGPHWDALVSETNDLISENIRLRQLRTSQLAQLDATLGSLQEAVLLVDRDNRILLANQALQALFPRAAANTNLLHHRLETIIHGAAFFEYVEAVRRGTARPQHEIEFPSTPSPAAATSRAGRHLWLEVTGTTIPALTGDDEAWALFVLHDITKQKKLEAVRKEFVANVSHELRTPLSIIKGYAETLVDGHVDMPEADRDRFLRTIERHAERLNSLIEDLLTLSRLESANAGLRREPVAFTKLLATILDDYRARPAAAGRRLGHDFDPAIGELQLDPLKITQALENLLDNALKYTPPTALVQVSARRAGAGMIEVAVRDNGPGIPAADLPHIFERFYRVDKGRSRDKGGTGLGLSIVKHIVQLHGGQVRAESTEGQGSVFYFTLPEK